MAVDLRCPNCADNLGKDVENPRWAFCGNCGTGKIDNPRGYTEEDEQKWNEEWAIYLRGTEKEK